MKIALLKDKTLWSGEREWSCPRRLDAFEWAMGHRSGVEGHEV